MRVPFEERVLEPLPVPSPPGRVDEMSLRIARRGEGAAIGENGFSLYRQLPRAWIRSQLGDGEGASLRPCFCHRIIPIRVRDVKTQVVC
jgi:hypothetical protein